MSQYPAGKARLRRKIRSEHGYRPITVEAVTLFKKDMPRPRTVETAQAGAAEALYGLGGGAALGRREQELTLANRGLVWQFRRFLPVQRGALCVAFGAFAPSPALWAGSHKSLIARARPQPMKTGRRHWLFI
jgi:hypothetical protein